MTLARGVFVGTLLAFLALGALSSRWISVAHFDDPFVYGRAYLWGALDSGVFHFTDSAVFFDPRPLEHALHPGLTVDLLNAVWMRPASALLGARADVSPLTHMVTHHRAYFGLCSFASALLFAACCWPLFAIVRALRGPEAAWWACALHLSSVPVLLFANRLSSEPYLLFFGLVALRLLIEPDAAPTFRRGVVWGAAATLSLLAKPLFAALLPLALVFWGRGRPWGQRLVGWGGAALGAAGPMAVFVVKLPPRVWLTQLRDDLQHNRGLGSPWDTFALENQAPFVGYHALLLGLALAGAGLTWRQADGEARRRLRPLGLFLALSLLLVARRPDWHYYFAFFWALPAAAFIALEAGLRRLDSPRVPAGALAALGLGLMLAPWTLDAATTFKQYHDRFVARQAAYARAPLAQPALWERRPGDEHLDTAGREGWPRPDPRLLAELARLRQAR